MNDLPVNLTIIRQSDPGQAKIVRLEGRDHLKTVFRLDVDRGDFIDALMGAEVIAAFSRGDAP